MDQGKLDHMIAEHGKWLKGEGGERMVLRGADLSYSVLRRSDLSGSDLSGSNLRGSNLSGSDLRGSDLRDSDIRCSNLRGSDLDFSCLPLWCGSFGMKVDDRILLQMIYHIEMLDKSECSKTLQKAWGRLDKGVRAGFCAYRDDVYDEGGSE